MNITDLNPSIVWKYFHEITQVPRPSKREGKMIAFLESFAAKHSLPCKKDAVGNILICKPASAGFEAYPTIIIQSHIDMVCVAAPGKAIDFDNDPIETLVEGEWLCAKDTSLGSDNGIGVAAQLAILASSDIEHGPLECLFTVDEEAGMTGANAIESGFMAGKILLNLDSEDEGEIFIGCAGGKSTEARLSFTPQPAPADLDYFTLQVGGLQGGHSGGEIHKGRGNACKILARFLLLLHERGIRVANIESGTFHNVIPSEATAIVGIKPELKEEVRALLNGFIADLEAEFKIVDPGITMSMTSAERPATCIDPNAASTLIYTLNACPHGVAAMSQNVEGLVETSTNLAVVRTEAAQVVVITSQRSSIESGKEAIAGQVLSVFKLAGAQVTQSDGYPGWAPNPASPLLKVAAATYSKLFGKDPQVKAIHAGLECGLFLAKYPWMDMISFGPTLRGVHSVSERINIPTVDLWWRFLIAILKDCKI
ncbi:MAG: aminoacyl-histidine dipeptidase [Tannerellaceae bacterium]|jgi:dipeptidase D|nr:aminoacyl-histidine dipeptidase [Tannerellaceae bacterium]